MAARLRSLLLRWALAAAAAVVLFGIVGWLALPAAARWGIETVGSRELGRTLRAGEIGANPFTLRITVRDLTLAEADAAAPQPFVAVDKLAVDLSIASLFRRAPVLDALRAEGLRVNLVRTAAQRFNFSDIVDRLQAAPASDDGPARFSLANIEIVDGGIAFDDRVLGKRHALTELAVGVPFLSSLPTHAEITVQPAFVARLDGTPIDLRGETRPFAETLESALQLKLDGLDLPTYLGFSPVRLNFAVPRGKLDTDLRIAFRRAVPASAERPARPAEVVISGTAALRDFALAAGADAPLIEWQRLGVRIGELAPLARRLTVDEITLAGPTVRARRDASGRLDWLALAEAPVAGTPATTAPAEAAPSAAAPGTAPFVFALARATLSDGRIELVDESLGRFEYSLQGLAAEVSALTNAAGSAAAPTPPARVKLTAGIVPQGRVAIDGEVGLQPLAAQLAVQADDVQLRGFARVLAQVVDGSLDGHSSVRATLQFAAPDAAAPQVELRDLQIDGRDLRLRGPAGSGAELDLAGLRLEGGQLDLAQRRLRVARLSLDGPRVAVGRLSDGSIGWQQLVRPAAAAPAPAAPPAPWAIRIDEIALARGQVAFTDASVDPATRVTLGQLQGSIANVSADGSTRAELSLRTRVGKDGTLVVGGGLRWDRLLANLRFSARNLDLAAAQGHLAAFVNAALVSGELSSRGTLALLQPEDGPLRVRFDGDARLANLHLTDADGRDDLLRWQSLAVDRIALELGAGAPQLDLGVVALDEFYARVILSEQGRLNLADLRRSTGADVAAPSAPTATAEPAALPPHIRVDRIQLSGGNVNFTDNFVKPNYTANLTDLAGSVTTLASDSPEPAAVVLNGRVDGDAPLSISGRLNPLAPKLQLDIAASTKGVDLPRLTPYSAKYAGYPITKGKLSLDVRYEIKDDKLTASNRLFLDQLTFGERVDSPEATKLPVLLAVSLLKNSRGEIDINLPISGSLDDPEFSIGGIIVRVIVNLLGKVVTAPFSLLAAAFGGGEELGRLDFAPGSAALEPAQLERLQTLSRALADRPALRLDIAGRADAATDTPGLREAEFEARLRAARVRQLVRAGGASVDPAQVTIPPEERAALIAAVYAAEPIADKPRVLGIARNIPVAEMERLIRAHLAQAPVDLRALANARAAAARDWLENNGKIERERMFVVEPKLGPAEPAAGAGKAPPGLATGVEFALR